MEGRGGDGEKVGGKEEGREGGREGGKLDDFRDREIKYIRKSGWIIKRVLVFV